MKKTVVLMRHGEAVETAESDYERPLTPKGEADVRAQGNLMMEKNIWPDVVLCSSAVRTRQTYDLLHNIWEGEMEPLMENRTDLYRCAPEDVIKMIRAQDPGHHTVMVIGHNPVIHQLAMLLSAEGKKKSELKRVFPPAGCAVLDFPIRSWSEVVPNKAELIELFFPQRA